MKEIWLREILLEDDQLRWIVSHCIDINRLDLMDCNITNNVIEELVREIRKKTQPVTITVLA